MTRATLLLLAIFALTATSYASKLKPNDQEMRHMWNQWKDLHLKNYTDAEESHRASVFAENYNRIVEFNAKNSDVTLAINKFADLSAEEFKSKYRGGHHHKSATEEEPEPEADAEDKRFLSSLPSSFDWRTKGALTAVKNQKDCKACWAFSSSDALEALHFIKTGSLLTFSEQQLIDCDTKAHACKSGNMLTALTYTADNGIELGSTYPFIDKEGSCKFSSSKAYNVNKGYKRVTSNSVTALKTAIVNQPVLVAIEANQDVFQFYKSGVISSGCGATTDHAVLAVGYETVNGQQAFIIKNSWGSSWGVSGYAYISASSTANSGKGVCGILSYAGYPTD